MLHTAAALDAVDRSLLEALQKDGRATVGKLAERVYSPSTSPCWRRVRQLEESGVISGYHAHLNRHRVGYGVLGFVHLGLHNHTAEVTAAFEREVLALPQVLSCHNLSGRYDYQIELVAPDLETFADISQHASAACRGCAKYPPAFRSRKSSAPPWRCRWLPKTRSAWCSRLRAKSAWLPARRGGLRAHWGTRGK